MAQEEPNRLVEWFLLIRKQGPVVRRHLENWLAAVREEPTLIWRTPAVRYGTYGVVGLVLLIVAIKIPALIVPAPPAGAKPEATTADFHVVCANPDCEHHFVINRKFGFRKFPVQCPKCEQRTGMQARRCYSQTCQGRWVAPKERDDRWHCPRCGKPLD